MAIVQTGSTLTFAAPGTGNTGTVSSTITVPADATLVVVGWSGYSSTAHTFDQGSMTFTKGGVDTAMTPIAGGSTSNWGGGAFYLNAPDTGSNKTLKWDWLGTVTTDASGTLCSVTFWKGNDITSTARGTGAADVAAVPVTSSSITALTGDLIIGWIGAFASPEGSATTLTNCTLISQLTFSGNADGAWVQASPTGNQTIGCSASANWADTTIFGASFKPAASGPSPLAAGAGSYTITGTAVNLIRTRILAASAGSYAINGSNAGLNVGRKVTAGAGSYTINGTAVGFLRGYRIIAGFGAYNWTGSSVNTLRSRVVAAGAGAYNITGSDVTLSKSTAKVLAAGSGAYNLTGSSVNLLLSRRITAASAAYQINGSDANLTITAAGGTPHSGRIAIKGRIVKTIRLARL